jgi:hypothetical protein
MWVLERRYPDLQGVERVLTFRTRKLAGSTRL